MVLTATAKAVTFILTKNRPRADAFYGQVLGLSILADDGFAGIFDLRGAALRITEAPDHNPAPRYSVGK
jgi:catechol-2,3-dioxygenase